MNVKLGVQTWSKNPQPGLAHKSDEHLNSARDEQKVSGDLGDTLNKVADPNYIDPSKKMRTVGNPDLGKDAFMNLLLAQMKSQDPTNPMKSHEMAAQLAQFTSLEKLTNIDQGIEKMRSEVHPERNFEALALIGKTVSTDSSKFTRLDQKSTHDIRFRLAADAITTDIKIKDAKGNVVRTLSLNSLKSGKTSIPWNGQLEDGTSAPPGDYTVEIDAKASNGHKVFAESKASGVITGVNFTPRGPQVMIGKEAIDLSDVKTISDPSLMENPEPTGSVAAKSVPDSKMMPIPKAAKPVEETKENALKKAKLEQGSIADAAISRNLTNKLAKEGVPVS